MNVLMSSCAWLLTALLLLSSQMSLASGIAMDGEFSSVEVSGAECDPVFMRRDYHLDFFILENPRGAVIHFDDAGMDGIEAGFFDGLNLVGNRGYDDLLFEKTIKLDTGLTFKVRADGIYSQDLILLDFEVTGLAPEPGEPVCQSKAELFARKG